MALGPLVMLALAMLVKAAGEPTCADGASISAPALCPAWAARFPLSMFPFAPAVSTSVAPDVLKTIAEAEAKRAENSGTSTPTTTKKVNDSLVSARPAAVRAPSRAPHPSSVLHLLDGLMRVPSSGRCLALLTSALALLPSAEPHRGAGAQAWPSRGRC